MKKFLFIFLSVLIYPINILGYSENIIPGGENIGIVINSDGLIVVGFYKVNDSFIAKETLKIGDVILEIEGIKIENINEMSEIIEKNIENNKVNIKIKRNLKEINTTLNLAYSEETKGYKTGLYVKENVTGIGTLTYIDPISKIYGSLGHEIILSETNRTIEIKNGNIFESYVKSIDKSREGVVGSKNANIFYDKNLGTALRNTSVGVFGKYTLNLPNKDVIEVADFEEISEGEALMYTSINGEDIKAYKIYINNKNKSKINSSKSISFTIEDQELLDITGGIIQGMSGSPIIQNNKIIGAVTHVIVDSPYKGYGVFIRTMLKEGEN